MKKLLEKLQQLKDFTLYLITGLWYLVYTVLVAVKRKTVKEWSALVTVVVLFFLSNTVLRWLDPTAATYDAGVLQVINVTLIMYAVFMMVAWSSYKTLWPDLGHFMKYYFKITFLLLSPWEKMRIAVFVFCFYLLTLVLLSRIF